MVHLKTAKLPFDGAPVVDGTKGDKPMYSTIPKVKTPKDHELTTTVAIEIRIRLLSADADSIYTNFFEAEQLRKRVRALKARLPRTQGGQPLPSASPALLASKKDLEGGWTLKAVAYHSSGY
jgi:hypothetical protein